MIKIRILHHYNLNSSHKDKKIYDSFKSIERKKLLPKVIQIIAKNVNKEIL